MLYRRLMKIMVLTNGVDLFGRHHCLYFCLFFTSYSGHPTCLKMPPDLVARIKFLRWRCVDCKRCCLCQPNEAQSTTVSELPAQSVTNADTDLLLCDHCDRGFHLNCLQPRLSEPPEGRSTMYAILISYGVAFYGFVFTQYHGIKCTSVISCRM